MRITQFLDKDCIKIPLLKEKKYEVIEELLDLITDKYPEIDRQEILQNLIDREKLESTAIGNHVAIPHARSNKIQKVYFAFGITEKSESFDALDGKPVYLVFLLLCPEKKISTQLTFLARLSRILHDKKLIKKLMKCKNSQNVIDIFTEYENIHFS